MGGPDARSRGVGGLAACRSPSQVPRGRAGAAQRVREHSQPELRRPGRHRNHSARRCAGFDAGTGELSGPARADRTAAAEHGDRRGANVEAARAPGPLARRPVFGGLRTRGDDGRPRPGRQRGAQALAADRRGARRADARRRPRLPAGDPGLPAWRRLLHRGQGQPGSDVGIVGRGRPDPRLHPDRGRVGRGGGRGHHLGDTVGDFGHGAARAGRDRGPGVRKPARSEGGRRVVRRAHVHVYRRDRADRDRRAGRLGDARLPGRRPHLRATPPKRSGCC